VGFAGLWYAHTAYREFVWVSRPDTRHSRNIAARPDVAIVIFDSTVAPSAGRGVYLEAIAEQIPELEQDTPIAIFSDTLTAAGARAWSTQDARAPAQHRLYHAEATAHYLLDATDHRHQVPLALRVDGRRSSG
jgi:hypothetical protein